MAELRVQLGVGLVAARRHVEIVQLDPAREPQRQVAAVVLAAPRDRLDLLEGPLRDIVEASGAKEVRVLSDARLMGTHLLGTCRMGEDPKSSVCNPFGQTHDVRNLFIADGSLFPTATPANPTLTIQAMATRVAFHIDERFVTGTLPG